MKNNTVQIPNRLNPTQVLPRKLILICWSIIILIAVATLGSSVQLVMPNMPTIYPSHMLIMNFIVPGLYSIVTLLLMIRFFSGCRSAGIFSPIAISSIRWIGRLVLMNALIRLADLLVLSLTADIIGGWGFHLALFFATGLSGIIMGIFLMILAKIMSVASGMEKELEFTV